MRVSKNSIEVSEYFASNLIVGCSVFSWCTKVLRSSRVPFHKMNMSSSFGMLVYNDRTSNVTK